MLILSNENNCSFIGLQSDELKDVIDNTTNYSTLRITIKKDCCNTYEQELDLSTGFTTEISTDGELILISPEFFNQTGFTDSIFEVDIKIVDVNSGTIEDSNCFFFDCDIKCKLFGKIEEKPDDELVLLHYALTQGSNCGCNCKDLCDLLYELKDLLHLEGEKCDGC